MRLCKHSVACQQLGYSTGLAQQGGAFRGCAPQITACSPPSKDWAPNVSVE